MKKTTKFIALLVAITMLFSVMSTLLSSSVYADEPAYVCMVGDTGYETVTAAIEAIESEGTIVLTSNVTESIIIPNGKTITLNLNGYTITDDGEEKAQSGEGMSYAATIENEGTLTITGSGIVDCTKANCAAVMNYMGGTLTIESGTYLRSSEAGSDWDANTNSCYVIINDGTMVINGGTFTSSGTLSSLVINGYRNQDTESGTDNIVTATLTINGGSFSGGDSTIKSGDYGELIINGGSFTNTNDEGSCIQVYENCTINGGTFSATNNVIEFAPGYIDDGRAGDGFTLTITGGTFTSTSTSASSIYVVTYTENSIIIKGGTFNNTAETISIYLSNLLDKMGIDTNIEIYCGTFSNPDESVTSNLATEATFGDDGDVHSYGEGVVVDPTCEEDGYTYYTCEYCGDTYSDSYVDALGHDWDEGVVTKEATEDEEGEITYTCLNDPTHTYTEVIPALGSEEDEDEDVNKSDSGEAEDVTDEGTSVLPNTGDIVLGAWVALIVVAGVAFAFTFKKSRK